MSKTAVRGSTARSNQLTVCNKNWICATHRLHSQAKAIKQCPDVTSPVLLYRQSLWLEFWILNTFSTVTQCAWHILVDAPSMHMPHVYAVRVEISLIMFSLWNSWHPTNHERKITNWQNNQNLWIATYSTRQTQGILQTRSAREANAYLSRSNACRSSFERMKVLVRTHEGPRLNAWRFSFERVSPN